jgi:ABC-type multidrug transport system ATPase subunit
MNHSAVILQNLSKSYKTVKALTEINVTINKGELFGFIGPDGAGKTTLFRILTTLLNPDTGSATVEGLNTVKDYKSIRNIVGYMPGRFSLYQDLTVEENLKFFASIYKTTIEENYHLISDIYKHIEPFKHRKAGKLSGGMKQKLALSCALIHKPEVLFLDEPTTGVDAVSRMEFWEMLKKLRSQGITILVSTPYMDEAALCDRVALMQNGHIMTIDTPDAIIGAFPVKIYTVRSNRMYHLLNELQTIPETEAVYRFGDVVHYLNHSETFDPMIITRHLDAIGHTEIVVKQAVPTIEDSFMLYMRKSDKFNIPGNDN